MVDEHYKKELAKYNEYEKQLAEYNEYVYGCASPYEITIRNTQKEDEKMNENQKKFLPKDVQELVEGGVLSAELLLTKYGADLVLNQLVKDAAVRKELVAKVIADRKENCC